MDAIVIVFAVFALLLFLNVPIAYSLGLSAVTYILLTGALNLTSFASVMITSVDSFPLMAIPFFILSGAFMDAGGLSKRLVGFAMSLVGHITGGLAMVAVVACAFFAALSGSGIATTAAIGAIIVPEMAKAGYNTGFSVALVAAAGCLGPIIPPSVPMVMFGASTNASIAAMFIGGVIPGLILACLLMLVSYIYAKKNGLTGNGEGFRFKTAFTSFLSAIPPLFVPVIILGGIYGGVFTPTEAAAIAVDYCLIIGIFVYKEMTFAKVKAALIESATQTGTILIIAAAATFFARILTIEQFHARIQALVFGLTDSVIVVMIIINIILLVLGCLMDTTPVILIFAPILYPIAAQYGVNIVHFGVMMCINLAIGLITPPVGISLYVAAGVGKLPFTQVVKSVWPFLFALLVGLTIIVFFPDTVLFLPKALGTMK